MRTVSLTEFRTTRKVVAHSGVSVSVLLQGAIVGLQPPWMWLTSSHGLGTWMDCRVEREREPAESKCAPSLLPGRPWCEPPVLWTPAAQTKVSLNPLPAHPAVAD